MKSIISSDLLKELLPQKKPFVMVSHLLDYSSDVITTGMVIDKENLFIEDGCFNESGMIENIAQTTALHTGYDFYLRKEKAPIGYIGTISNVVVMRLPKLNEEITTKVEIIKEFMGVTMIHGSIYRGEELLMTAKMKTFLADQ